MAIEPTPAAPAQATPPAAPAATPPAPAPAATPAAGAPAPAAPDPALAAEQPVAGDFPEDWREKIAGTDEKWLGQLKRYASPKALAEAQRSAAERIRKGQIKETLAADATPEQVAEYRKANNVPETADKYDTALDGGLVIGEADKPLVDGYLKHAHEKNMPAEVVKANLGWYFSEQQRQAEAQFEKDAVVRNETTAALRDEYGPEYKRHVRAAEDYFAEAGDDFRDSIMQARMPEGTLVGANAKAVRFFINRALDHNPFATTAPSGQGGAQASVETEMAALTTEMGDPDGPYWKGPLAKAKQARVLEINNMMERARKRA